MFIPRKLFEEEEIPKNPITPKIENQEAIKARKELNRLLNREDIISNALPSKEEKPLIILIHGYGSSKWLWIEPYFGTMGWLRNYHQDPKPRNYGWHSKPPPAHMYVPFSMSISPLIFPDGLFNRLMRRGYEVLTYTQIDPFGEIDTSAKEIELILNGIKKIYGNKNLIIVGHSRGGICIRRYLDLVKDIKAEKIITLGTPHKGTNLVNFVNLKQPLMKILNQENIKKFWDVSGNREVHDIKNEQYAYNSKFLLQLKDREKNPEIEYVSVAGSCSTYAHIYTWSLIRQLKRRRIKRKLLNIFSKENEMKTNQIESISKEKDKTYNWIAHPRKILTIFEKSILPEFKTGDGMVSLYSAILSDANRKYIFDMNHEELATSEKIERFLVKEIELTKRKF